MEETEKDQRWDKNIDEMATKRVEGSAMGETQCTDELSSQIDEYLRKIREREESLSLFVVVDLSSSLI